MSQSGNTALHQEAGDGKVIPAKARRGRKSTFFKVSLQKTYKDGDEFKTTTSLSRDDLPVAGLLLKRAWEFILESESKGRTRASDED